MLPIISNELTKTQVKVIADQCVFDLTENGNIMQAIETMAKMELLIKEIKASKIFSEYALNELSKYGKGVTTQSGTKIELAEVGTKYNFENCNDEILNTLNDKLEAIEILIKERKDFLKTLPSAGMDIITTDGEVVKIYPPYKTSTSSFKTTISK